MVQKEFATKLIAPPGDAMYTSFSVYTSAHFKVKRLFNVSRQCFYPVPNVDSSVIQLTPDPIEIPGDPALFFAMVHSGFWGESSKRYVSVVLSNSESNIFHLCIPIEYRNTSQDENLFLKYWLRDDSRVPSGFTFNEILNFRGPNIDKVQFAILQYCLKYNKTIKSSPAPPYTLCLFKTPLYVNSSDINWISNFPDTMYFKSSFNSIFNYMLKDRVYNHIDSRLVV
jgi:hypothetical protein